MHASERSGRETRGLRSALHVCSHFVLRPADSMLECRATCRGHPMPAESISIVGGCIGSRCRENSFVRRYDSFVSRSGNRRAARIARIIYTVIHNNGGEGILEWDYARIDELSTNLYARCPKCGHDQF